jgi:hypothetical protein
MPTITILIVGGSWVAILALTIWRVRTWREDADE